MLSYGVSAMSQGSVPAITGSAAVALSSLAAEMAARGGLPVVRTVALPGDTSARSHSSNSSSSSSSTSASSHTSAPDEGNADVVAASHGSSECEEAHGEDVKSKSSAGEEDTTGALRDL
jgi:hypothetical protein